MFELVPYLAVATNEELALAGVNTVAGEGVDLELLNSGRPLSSYSNCNNQRNAPSTEYHQSKQQEHKRENQQSHSIEQRTNPRHAPRSVIQSINPASNPKVHHIA